MCTTRDIILENCYDMSHELYFLMRARAFLFFNVVAFFEMEEGFMTFRELNEFFKDSVGEIFTIYMYARKAQNTINEIVNEKVLCLGGDA